MASRETPVHVSVSTLIFPCQGLPRWARGLPYFQNRDRPIVYPLSAVVIYHSHSTQLETESLSNGLIDEVYFT